MSAYTRDTVVLVRPFSQQPEGEEVIIGRVETGIFVAVPRGAIEVLEDLAQGRSVGEAADLYSQKHGAVPDLGDFLGIMERKGIIELAAGAPDSGNVADPNGNGAASSAPAAVRFHFADFPQSVAQRIFSRPVLFACFVVIAIGVGFFFRDPSVMPSLRDIYVSDHRTIIWTLLLIGSYGSVVIHEFAHMIAARAVGIRSRLGYGHRLWDFVIEADLSGLWSLPKRQRFLPLLAGSLLDSVLASLFFMLLYAHKHNDVALSNVWLRVTKLMLLTYLTRVMWQAFLFVRTDFYYVLANIFNCRSLSNDTEAFLRNQVARVFPRVRKVDQSFIPASERKVILAYALIWIVGRAIALSWFFSVTIPLGRSYIGNLGHALMAGYSAAPSDFVDSLLLVCMFIVPIAVGIPMWIGGMVTGAIRSLARQGA